MSDTEKELRARIDDLERQLIAYDAALDGNLDIAEQVAPGTFYIKRQHAAARLSPAILRRAFQDIGGPVDTIRTLALEAAPVDYDADALARIEDAVRRAWDLGRSAHKEPRADLTDDDAFMHWVWGHVRPKTHYVSCALPERDGYHPCIDLAANGAGRQDPVSGRTLSTSDVSLPRSGMSGLPYDWRWLLTSWRLEIRGAEGWDCSGLTGTVRFNYNHRRHTMRPLSDALAPRDEDLLLVMSSSMSFEVEVEVRNGIVRAGAAADAPPPRLYVFLDVIAHETVV